MNPMSEPSHARKPQPTPQSLPVQGQEDMVRVRRAVRILASSLGFSLLEQTKLITAASELARNTLVHGGGGTCVVESLTAAPAEVGIRLTFEDHGPGIDDLELALRDGFSTNHGLGLGLGGSRRMVNEFDLWSQVGEGTRVTITKWRRD